MDLGCISMPIYEFRCQNCGRDFERIQAFSDQSLPVCPTCQSASVQRKLSPPAVHFKGSGWYVTDSKNSTKSSSSSAKGDEEGGDKKAADASNTAEKSADDKGETTTKTEAVKEKESSSVAKEPAA
jgi:putative FmdB family regulatory protein